jgi:hypothetical protein
MEQRVAQMEEAHHGAKMLSDRRSLEKMGQRPHLHEDEINGPANTIGRGGGEAGLARVVGAGKKPRKGRRNAVVEGASDGVMTGGASLQGKMLGEHLMKLHGKGFFDDFAKGFMSVIKPVASVVGSVMPGPIGAVAKMISGGNKVNETPQGVEVEHARMPGNTPAGAVPAVAYGNAPQAPASFKRNTVGMGKSMEAVKRGRGRPRKAVPVAEEMEMSSSSEEEMKKPMKKKASGRKSARGAMVSKLMKTKGLSLGEASRYIKEHGLA